MKKTDAVRMFKEDYEDLLNSRKKDYPACREAWHTFVDSLHRDGLITDQQVNTWCNPTCVKKGK